MQQNTSAKSCRKEFGWNPIQAVLRRKTNGSWRDKHRNGMRKLAVEGWVQKRLTSVGQTVPLSILAGSEQPDPAGTEKVGTQGENVQWQRGITSHPFGGNNWRNTHLSVRMWESETHGTWSMPVEGFRKNVATDGSIFGGFRLECMWLASGASRP